MMIPSSYVIIYKKGYQEKEKPYSSVTTKLKGVSFTNLTLKSGSFPYYGGPFVWDEADYVVPPEVRIMIFFYFLSLFHASKSSKMGEIVQLPIMMRSP